MRWLVTGGAGVLGINLVRHLLARGDHVTSLDRAPFTYPEQPRITEVRGDVRDRADVARAVAGCDVVVHAAAAPPDAPPDELHAIIVGGTRTVLEAAGARRVVHVSSTEVYGVPDQHPTREADPLRATSAYGAAKVEAERACEAARDGGRDVCVLRPQAFVGPERRGVFAMLYAWAHEGRDFPILGKGENRYQLLDVHDLCTAIVLGGTLPAARARDTFNLGAHEFTTLREDLQAVLDAAGHRGRIRLLPSVPARWTLRRLDALARSPIAARIYETITQDAYVSIEKARSGLGWMPRYSNKAALVRNYRWFAECGEAETPSHPALALAKLVFRRHT